MPKMKGYKNDNKVDAGGVPNGMSNSTEKVSLPGDRTPKGEAQSSGKTKHGRGGQKAETLDGFASNHNFTSKK